MRSAAIFLGGPQGSGKTTAAEAIREILLLNDWHVEIIKFADPIYQLAGVVESMLAPVVGREPSVKDNPSILQDIGDIGRERYDQKIWINVAKARAAAMVQRGSQDNVSVCVIFEDVRKKGELELAKELEGMGFKTASMYFEASEEVRKARLGAKYRANTSHSTESEVQEFKGSFQRIIKTDGEERQKNSEISQHLKDAGFFLSVEKQLADLVDIFNECLNRWSESNRTGANFEFKYTGDGRKYLSVRDIAPIDKLPEDKQAIRISETEEAFKAMDPAPAPEQQV